MKTIKIRYLTPWQSLFETKKPSASFCRKMTAQLSPVLYAFFEKEDVQKLIPDLLFILFDHPSYFKPYVKNTSTMCWCSIMARSEPLIMCRFIVEWYSKNNEKILPWMDVANNELFFLLHISPEEKKHLFAAVERLLENHYLGAKCCFPFKFKMIYGGDVVDFCFKENVLYKTAQEIESIAHKASKTINRSDNSSYLQIDGISVKGKHILISVESDRCSKKDIISFISLFSHINGIESVTFR